MSAVKQQMEFKTKIENDGHSLSSTLAAVGEVLAQAEAAGVPEQVRMIHVHTMTEAVYLTVTWDVDGEDRGI